MSQKELLVEIERLENELKKKDEQIARLKEQRFKIRKLSMRIGKLCGDPAIRWEPTTEWAESNGKIKKRPTAGTQIHISSDILEPASSDKRLSIGDNNNFYKYKKNVGDVEPSHIAKQKWKGVKSNSNKNSNTTGKHEKHQFYSTKRKNSEENKIIKLSPGKKLRSRNSYESIPTEKDTREDFPEPATLKSLLDSNASEEGWKMMSEQTRSNLSGRSKKKKKSEAPKLPIKIQDIRQPEEDSRSSDELIVISNGATYKTSATSPHIPGLTMSQRTNMNLSPTINLHNLSMSDRSLSSLAEVLPSLPSDSSVYPLSTILRESTRESKPKHWV